MAKVFRVMLFDNAVSLSYGMVFRGLLHIRHCSHFQWSSCDGILRKEWCYRLPDSCLRRHSELNRPPLYLVRDKVAQYSAVIVNP